MIRNLAALALGLALAAPLAAQPRPDNLQGAYRLTSIGGVQPKSVSGGAVFLQQSLDLSRTKIDDNNYQISGTYRRAQLDGKDVSVPVVGLMSRGSGGDGTWFGALAGAKDGRNSVSLTFYTQDFKVILATEVIAGGGAGDKGGAFYTRTPAVHRFEWQDPKIPR